MNPVFVVAHPLTATTVGSRLLLDGAEGRHAATVVRLAVGERLDLVDGAGTRVHATVLATSRDTVTCSADEVVLEPAPSPRLVVVQALVKGDRATTAVETLTEVGVDVIVPWQASRSVSIWREDRAAKNLERWRSVAVAAGKQARRARHPDVRPVHSTAQVARLLASAATALVLHEEATLPLPLTGLPAGGDVVVVVGPEGGIGPDELACFVEAGAVAVRLGAEVLRASTAGTVATGVLMAATGRWRTPA